MVNPKKFPKEMPEVFVFSDESLELKSSNVFLLVECFDQKKISRNIYDGKLKVLQFLK